MAGMLSKLWDDVAGGSPPEKGMKQLRKQNSANSALFPSDGEKSKFGRCLSLGEYQSISTTPPQSIPMKSKPALPMLDISEATTSLGSTPPASPSPSSTSYPKEKDNLWRSVFSSSSKVKRNLSTGADHKVQQQESTSPTVYDWVVITALEG